MAKRVAAPKDNLAQKYADMIAAYDNEFKQWDSRAKRIIKRYRDERSDTAGSKSAAKFNILWSNVNTLVPATFSRLPKPDVSRRFNDNDPVGRVASLILERILSFEIEHYSDYGSALKASVYDRFLGGRGQSWVRYEPVIEREEAQVSSEEDVGEDSDDGEEPIEYLGTEKSCIDYVDWKDFGHNIARTWEEVTVVWRRVYMTKESLIERFGEEVGGSVPIDSRPPETKKSSSEQANQGVIYEIWDKARNKVIWISKGRTKVLDERTPGKDVVKLEAFWPCPKPLYATITSDSLIPVPDFSLYQDQAQTLDLLASRITGLCDALKVRGVYDASTPELARIMKEANNNELIGVSNWAAFTEKSGLKGSIDLVEIVPFAQALDYSYRAFEQLKSQVYEITGISDIIRGQSVASETATAQRLKGQYATLRLKNFQTDVAQFAAELLQIKAQIICAEYSDETIAKLGGVVTLIAEDQQLVPQAMQLLRDEPMRNFRISITSDSMVEADEQGEKQARMEFLNAAGGFLKEMVPAAQQNRDLAPLMMEMLKFGVTSFKVGKEMEGAFDQLAAQMLDASKQPPPEPVPDPMIQKVQMQLQADQQRIQFQAQQDQAKDQADKQFEQMKMQVRQQSEASKQQHEQTIMQMQLESKERIAQQQIAIEQLLAKFTQQSNMMLEQMRAASKTQVAEINKSSAIDVAEINSKTTLTTAIASGIEESAIEPSL